nr:site-specific integrase [Muribaculum sp.]
MSGSQTLYRDLCQRKVACGLRVIDIITLQWSDIDFDKRTLNKIQVKTKNRNVIPLSDQAMGILEQWKGRYNRFVFGLLDDDFNLDDTDALYRVRNTKTRGINQALNVIGEKLGLSFSLTFHVGRHTFAVLSLNNGMDMTMVSQLLGHSSTEITEKVYAHFMPARLREELSKIKLPSL